jgi:hypothetical protein
LRTSGQTDPACVTPNKKRARSYSQWGPHLSWEHVRPLVRGACGAWAPCMRVREDSLHAAYAAGWTSRPCPSRTRLAPRPAATCRAALFPSMCVVCAQAKLPYRIAAFANQLRRLASCRTGQAACLFVRGAWDHICMAAECWHKFFRHFMTSNSKCFMRLR